MPPNSQLFLLLLRVDSTQVRIYAKITYNVIYGQIIDLTHSKTN